MKKERLLLAAIIGVGIILHGGFASAQKPPSTKEKFLNRLHKKRDLHPAIHNAMMKLRHAKRELEKAKNEKSPHKTKAIEAINTALGELHDAIEHPKG